MMSFQLVEKFYTRDTAPQAVLVDCTNPPETNISTSSLVVEISVVVVQSIQD